MKIIEIEKWEDFDQKVTRKDYRKWMYRGQSNFEWKLESSLHRAFEEAKKLNKLNGKSKTINKQEHEKVMIERFKCHAHLYLDHLPKESDSLSWFSLMQHHGAPTRLLDFSFSPYVALYFALESGDGEASVYCINHHAIKSDDEAQFGDERLQVYSRVLDGDSNDDISCLFAFEPTFSNHRLLSQQGLFVATNSLNATHEEMFREYSLLPEDVIKFKIPATLRYSGLRKLNQMNINASNIYPGLDGFCKSMIRQPVFGLEWQKRVGN